jgi:hypothetical protein
MRMIKSGLCLDEVLYAIKWQAKGKNIWSKYLEIMRNLGI